MTGVGDLDTGYSKNKIFGNTPKSVKTSCLDKK